MIADCCNGGQVAVIVIASVIVGSIILFLLWVAFTYDHEENRAYWEAKVKKDMAREAARKAEKDEA